MFLGLGIFFFTLLFSFILAYNTARFIVRVPNYLRTLAIRDSDCPELASSMRLGLFSTTHCLPRTEFPSLLVHQQYVLHPGHVTRLQQ